MDPKIIREKLGLAPEATDEECLAKIDSLTTAATEKDAVANELEAAKTTATEATAKKDELACSLTAAESNIINLRVSENGVSVQILTNRQGVSPWNSISRGNHLEFLGRVLDKQRPGAAKRVRRVDEMPMKSLHGRESAVHPQGRTRSAPP